MFFHSENFHEGIPLHMTVIPVDGGRDQAVVKRLDHDVEECCAKLFSHYFVQVAREGRPIYVTRYFYSPQSVEAVIEHVPELLTLIDSCGWDRAGTKQLDISVSAALVASAAECVCRSVVSGKINELSGCGKEMIDVLLSLPTSHGAAFDLEVESSCKLWHYNNTVTLETVLDFLLPHKRQAEAWRFRLHWISACVQLGLNTATHTSETQSSKKQCL